MKKLIFLSLVMTASGLSQAQETGRVISATPVIQQVNIPRQVCNTEQVVVQQNKSGSGALIGAIAGGAMGNAVGGGSGKTAATMLGMFGGAIVGDRIEGAPLAQTQNIQRCSVQNFYENRTVAYNVVYEFSGKQYSVQMPNNPGPTLPLQITPVGATSQATSPNTVTSSPQSAYKPSDFTVVIEPDSGYGYGPRGRHHWR